MDDLDDKKLLEALGVSVESKKIAARSAKEERVIAGFEDILKFVNEHGRPPQHGEERDIFERLYAIRLGRLREDPDCRELLKELDSHELLKLTPRPVPIAEAVDDEALLAELGIEKTEDIDVTKLTHVKPREEVRAAEAVANRTPCKDFDRFKPLFSRLQADLNAGSRETRRFGEDAEIKKSEFFILGGQVSYIADMGDEFVAEYGRPDRRLRVIFDNGTESDLLLRSFQRALYKDDTGRRITDPEAGPLFGSTAEANDMESGIIYVLRSKSNHPDVAAHRDLIHKIGVTGGKVEARIANAKLDATYLLADVEVVATYKLFNINRTRLENILHRVFSAAQLNLTIKDRFGNPVRPREWFLVPLSVIDEVVEKIKDQSITALEYDPVTASLKKIGGAA